jgi:transposase/transposase-like protein
MITLKVKQEIIIMYLREGKSIREISRLLGIHRTTVTRYIKSYEARREELLNGVTQDEQGELTQAIVETPTYQTGFRSKRKLTEEMMEEIKRHLAENEVKIQNGQRKQVKKAIDIYDSLVKQGADISYSTIRHVVRTLKQKTQEAFIKQEYTPGDVCEFDWGHVVLTVGAEQRKFELAVFTSAYGNYRYAQLYAKQKTEHFQEAHAAFFEHIGGAYRTMVYDNMRVAVGKFVGREKQPTDGLLQLSLYYGFKFRFCNLYSGNEKGHVERSVDVIRRKAFAVRDTFESLEEANRYLLDVCRTRNEMKQDMRNGKTAESLLNEELPEMLPRMPKFDASRMVMARVDKYSTVTVEQNRYSVPDHLVGKRILVKVQAAHIRCYDEGVKVAEHSRCNGVHGWQLTLEHYLQTLKKKPGALAASTALHQAQTKIKSIYERYYTTRPRDFVDLMIWMQQEPVSLETVERAVEELARIHPEHVTTDKIKVVCARLSNPVHNDFPPSQQTEDLEAHAKRHLAAYGEWLPPCTDGEDDAA